MFFTGTAAPSTVETEQKEKENEIPPQQDNSPSELVGKEDEGMQAQSPVLEEDW